MTELISKGSGIKIDELIKPEDGLWGDSLLYYGLFSVLGVDLSQKFKERVDEEGRLWRNPAREIEHTSRDVLLGILLSGKSLSLGRLQRYLKRNDWKLSPTSPDRRHHVGLLGRIQLSHLTGRGLARKLCFSLPLLLLLSCLTPLKKPFEMHLEICTLLMYCGKDWKWGALNSWILRQVWRVLDYVSPNNAILKYIDKDYEALDKIRLGLLWEKDHGAYHDHWCFASYEPWRDARMAHPACLEWVWLAMKKLRREGE